jgi:hypothetical protein
MRRLAPKALAQILHLLCEGQAIRSMSRTGASKNTITKLLVDVGKCFGRWLVHDEDDVKALAQTWAK